MPQAEILSKIVLNRLGIALSRDRRIAVSLRHRADIGRTRPYQPAAPLLLAGMRRPSRGAGDRKNWRKRLPRDLQCIEQDRGEELHIGVERTVRFFPP